MSQKRQRIDERLVTDGLAETRSLAQRLIMAGSVRVNGALVDKPGKQILDEATVELIAGAKFVSRGGDKLDNALDDLADDIVGLGLTVSGAKAIDIGSSTGGFSDCLLQRGAATVIAVDVGYGQLHPKLRDDERVTVMERTNARHLTPDDLPYAPQMIVCDASFISLTTVLPPVFDCMERPFWGVLLCKPQFEAGKERMNKHGSSGVLRDADVRQQVVDEVVARLTEIGLLVDRVVEARPPGPKGNIEYSLLVRGM